MIRQGAYNHADKFENYHCELICLMPWLGLHIAKHSDQGSALQMVKYAMSTTTIEGRDSPRTVIEDRMEPHTDGATT